MAKKPNKPPVEETPQEQQDNSTQQETEMTQEASTSTTASPAASKTEYTPVTMEDGTVVQFPGTRQTAKTISVNEEAATVEVRFDFRNGSVRKISSAELAPTILLRLIGHGLSQKVGDSWASIKTGLDDCLLQADEVLGTLKAGDWGVVREASDSMAGASLVIRALCEVTGKDVNAVKAFLDGKITAAKAAGEKLTRQDLYASLRNPKSATGKVIARLEEEKAAKSNKGPSADDLIADAMR